MTETDTGFTAEVTTSTAAVTTGSGDDAGQIQVVYSSYFDELRATTVTRPARC